MKNKISVARMIVIKSYVIRTHVIRTNIIETFKTIVISISLARM